MSPSEYRAHKFASGKPQHCWMCGCVLTLGTSTVDHLKAKSRKGKDERGNYRLACIPCNSSRGNRRLTADEMAKATGRQKKKKRDFSKLIEAIQKRNTVANT